MIATKSLNENIYRPDCCQKALPKQTIRHQTIKVVIPKADQKKFNHHQRNIVTDAIRNKQTIFQVLALCKKFFPWLVSLKLDKKLSTMILLVILMSTHTCISIADHKSDIGIYTYKVQTPNCTHTHIFCTSRQPNKQQCSEETA